MITTYKIGLACKLQAPNVKIPVMCRILGEVKGGASNKGVPSKIVVITPLGGQITTGAFFLHEIKTEAEGKELKEQEKNAMLIYEKIYGGKLNEALNIK